MGWGISERSEHAGQLQVCSQALFPAQCSNESLGSNEGLAKKYKKSLADLSDTDSDDSETGDIALL